jgi:hypothetical protein
MTSGLANTGASMGFTDALSGADGTADPVSPVSPDRIYPDPTQDILRDAGSDRWVTSSTGATTLVTPGSAIVIDPAMVARAEAEIAQRRAADQAAVIKAEQDRRHAEGARRDAAARAAARTHAPQVPAQVLNFTQWLPPSAQEAVRKGLAQMGGPQMGGAQKGTAQMGGAQTGARQQRSPARAPARPTTPQVTPPAGSQQKKRSTGNSVWGVLVFIIVVLFATGLGQRIVEALSQLFNR